MSRTKPKFGYSEPLERAPELRREFVEKICSIIQAGEENTEFFLDELRIVLHRYQLRKKTRTSSPEGKPTAAEERANAEIILKTVSALIEQLSGEAGGIKHYLNNGIAYAVGGRASNPSTQLLSLCLQGAKFGCQDFLDLVEKQYDDIRISRNDIDDVLSPLDYLAESMAKLIADILKEKPTTYVYEGIQRRHQKDGKFARLLQACFDEVDNGALYDVRSLMKRAVKNL